MLRKSYLAEDWNMMNKLKPVRQINGIPFNGFLLSNIGLIKNDDYYFISDKFILTNKGVLKMTEKKKKIEKVEKDKPRVASHAEPVEEKPKGETDLQKACQKVLKDALIDFGLTRQKANKLSKTNFMKHNVDIPFACGRLVINKGTVRKLANKKLRG